jgi:Tol biopolymer transport system component
MNKFMMFLMLALLVSACTANNQIPPPTVTPSKTSVPTLTATDIQGSTPTPTNMIPTIPAMPHPGLNTSGPYLAYLSSQEDQYEIVLLDANGIGRKVVPYPGNTTYLPNFLSNILSPDGHWLAYYTGSAAKCFGNAGADTADLTLNLLNLADGKSQVVTRLLAHDYPNNFIQAAQQLNQSGITADSLQNSFGCGMGSSAWSPDGRYLAFAGQMDGLSSDVYLYDTESHAIKRLSNEPEEVEMISWSPDGQRIIEWSNFGVGEGMTHDVYILALDGRVVYKLFINRGSLDWLYGSIYSFWGRENEVGPNQLGFVDIQIGKVIKVWDQGFSFLAVSADQQWLACYYSGGKEANLLPGSYIVNLSTFRPSPVELPSIVEGNQKKLQVIGSGDQTFGFLNASDNILYFLSPYGKLSSTGIRASSFSVSPDRQYLVTFGQKIHILKTDGAPIRNVDFPANMAGQWVWMIIWRPDSSGLFFTYWDSPPGNSNVPKQLYAMDLSTGRSILVDSSSPALNDKDFVWVTKP